MSTINKKVSVNHMDHFEQDLHSVYEKGYVVLKQVFQPDDIHRIALCFNRLYMDKFQRRLVQNRNYKRFTCKIPVGLSLIHI